VILRCRMHGNLLALTSLPTTRATNSYGKPNTSPTRRKICPSLAPAISNLSPCLAKAALERYEIESIRCVCIFFKPDMSTVVDYIYCNTNRYCESNLYEFVASAHRQQCVGCMTFFKLSKSINVKRLKISLLCTVNCIYWSVILASEDLIN